MLGVKKHQNEMVLKPIEEDAFMEIVNMGLTKAADAMSAIIGENIFIKCVETMRAEEVYKEIDYYHLNLVTEMQGDIKGTCCLVFTRSDAQYLTKKRVLVERREGRANIDGINNDFLLELDNQIAGAVITQLSDTLQLNLYGDQPRLEPWDTMKNTKMLLKDNYGIFFRTQFRTNTINFSPTFYWFFEPKIVSAIKDLLQGNLTI